MEATGTPLASAHASIDGFKKRLETTDEIADNQQSKRTKLGKTAASLPRFLLIILGKIYF